MRLWLSKNSDVSVREQITTQLILAITSGEIPAGKRLPSTRELARRLKVHANTISAAYRELARRGRVESRRGSGVYARAFDAGDAPPTLDRMIAEFLQETRKRGFTSDEVRERIIALARAQTPKALLVIEPDAELRRILETELEEATMLPVRGAGFADCKHLDLTGTVAVALHSQAEGVRASLGESAACVWLHSRSATEALSGEEMPSEEALIAVVSRWSEFLRWARAILNAAGVNDKAIVFRDARREDWRKGLRASAIVVADAFTARALPRNCSARIFRIISDASLEELKNHIAQRR